MKATTRRVIVQGMELLTKAETHLVDYANEMGVLTQDEQLLKKQAAKIRDLVLAFAEDLKQS